MALIQTKKNFLPPTRATAISPLNKALILFSICLKGATRCDSLSCSSSSSIGGAKSRRGVDKASSKIFNLINRLFQMWYRHNLNLLLFVGTVTVAGIIGSEETRTKSSLDLFKESLSSSIVVLSMTCITLLLLLLLPFSVIDNPSNLEQNNL